jgi:hypothetical protein
MCVSLLGPPKFQTNSEYLAYYYLKRSVFLLWGNILS